MCYNACSRPVIAVRKLFKNADIVQYKISVDVMASSRQRRQSSSNSDQIQALLAKVYKYTEVR